MKKWQKLTFAALGVLSLAVGAGVLWQKENIQAVYEGMNYSQSDIEEQIRSTKRDVQGALERYGLQGVRALTLEEEAQIKKGELSIEDAIKRMMPEDNKGADMAVEANADREVHEEPKFQKSEEMIVKAYTAKIYTLQAKYLGLLGSVETRGIQALKAIPSEKRTAKKMMDVGMSFVQEGLGLENQCDGEVNGLLESLKQELIGIDADYTIVETMRQAYNTEKRLKKAYYFSLIP